MKKSKEHDYLKAYRKASREAELEFEHGWKVKNKAHRGKKKPKHKKRPADYFEN